MLSAAKHLDAHPDRPFAALRACPERSEWGDKKGPPSPYGILDLCLRLMPITADLSALGDQLNNYRVPTMNGTRVPLASTMGVNCAFLMGRDRWGFPT